MAKNAGGDGAGKNEKRKPGFHFPAGVEGGDPTTVEGWEKVVEDSLGKARKSLLYYRDAGRALCAIKRLKRKRFTKWLEESRLRKAGTVSPQQSRKYMKLWENWARIEPHYLANPDLSLDDALALLVELPDQDRPAPPPTPLAGEGTVEEVCCNQARLCVATADCLEFLKDLPENSLDNVCGSPPYHGKWRRFGSNLEPSVEEWVDWMLRLTVEAVRACKGWVVWVVNGCVRDGCYQPSVEGLSLGVAPMPLRPGAPVHQAQARRRAQLPRVVRQRPRTRPVLREAGHGQDVQLA
jgi:hypothetical protein